MISLLSSLSLNSAEFAILVFPTLKSLCLLAAVKGLSMFFFYSGIPMQGEQVWSWVRELRPHMPRGEAKKKKKKVW